MTLLRRPWIAALLLGLAAQLLFSVNLTRPSAPVFDEVHYLPAARAIAEGRRPGNTEHPLLAKQFMALGIATFGDTALGWRASATLAGTATVLGVFAILMLLFGSVPTAAFGAALAMLNFPVFIQARIAMLDAWLGAFVTLGIAALLWAVRGRTVPRWIAGSALLGLATACKWTAAPYVAFAGGAFFALKVKRPALWPGLHPFAGVVLLGLISIAAYFATFLPAFLYADDPMSFAALIPFQREMYELQTQVLSPHTYQSNWQTWPLMIRPMWYLYEPVDGAVRGILLLGNPAVQWGGLLAVLWLGWRWWLTGAAIPGALALLWVASLAVWAVIPKSLGFFYYYHLSGLWLCLALAAAFHLALPRWAMIAFLALTAALFVHFYPIIAAAALPDPQAFNRWMWLDSWR